MPTAFPPRLLADLSAVPRLRCLIMAARAARPAPARQRRPAVVIDRGRLVIAGTISEQAAAELGADPALDPDREAEGRRHDQQREHRRQREPADHGDAHRGAPAIVRSEEHTSELQSLMRISYAVFCLKKTTQKHTATLR